MDNHDNDSEDLLRRALRLAYEDPVNRPAFYKLLLDSEVFVIGNTADSDGETKQTMLKQGDQVQIANMEADDGTPFIPFFSTLEKMQAVVHEKVDYLGMPARMLFEITAGKNMALNPGDEFGKFFVAQEITELLAHGLPGQVEQHINQSETEVMLGRPAKQPTEILDTLGRLFAQNGHVSRAWLIQFMDPARHKKPAFLVGIDGDRDQWNEICESAYTATATFLDEGQAMEFAPVDPGNPDELAKAIMETDQPFFERPARG